MRTSKRVLAVLLALVLVLGLCPVTALAATGDMTSQVYVRVENNTCTTIVNGEGQTVDAPFTGTLAEGWVTLTESMTMMDCVLGFLEEQGIAYTLGANDTYISGIGELGEQSQGGGPSDWSGWMGSVNDWFPDASFSDVTPVAGDEIRVQYSLDGGTDLGASWQQTGNTALQALTFSAGVLEPEFASDTLAYTLTVPAGTTSLKVTPTAACKKNPVVVKVGDTSYQRLADVPVSDGTVITITCGNATTYTVTVALEIIDTITGSGTQDDPYILDSAADFDRLDALVTEGETYIGSYFKLAKDVTLSNGWDGIGYSKVEIKESWGCLIPSTTEMKPFGGNFDGQGYTITIPSGGKALFDCVRSAEIKDFDLYGAYIDDDGVVGNYIEDSTYPAFTAKISGVTILSGTKIAGSGFLGGYAASANVVNITDCHVSSGVSIGVDASGNPNGANRIGSIAGEFNGTVENCTSAATVYGSDFVGGLVGGQGQAMSKPVISSSSFSGAVIATGNYAGGILGSGYTGTGWGFSGNGAVPTVKNCTVTGTVQGGDYVGGIFGAELGVLQCWENGMGAITGNTFEGTLSSSGDYVGGIIGYMVSLNKYVTISGNRYSGADKGIGGIAYVDTCCANPTEVEGTQYIDTSVTTDGLPTDNWTSWNENHNRTDDPLGADAETLCAKIAEPVELPFTDVEGHWAEDAIRYAYENKLFVGTSETEFSPEATMTRAMLVAVLYRMAGNPEVTGSSNFTDVPDGEWYANAVIWAASSGIVSGYGNGLFGTNDNVTREQFVSILYRYGKAVAPAEDNLSGFVDCGDISAWAVNSMRWAVAEGLIAGRLVNGTDTMLVPQGNATRAEAAALLMRFANLNNK